MNRAAFFAAVRTSLFAGRLTQSQVDGIDAILDEWDAEGLTDTRWLAYMLATVFHETAQHMQPITEFGGVHYFDKYDTGSLAARLGNTPEADGDGYKYRGRGLVQITGHANYQKFGLADDPDKALDPKTATKIMFIGMRDGMFTGLKLSSYFRGNLADWVNARRIINGLDKANLIADYAKKFAAAIDGAQ
jgi:putative chitinase